MMYRRREFLKLSGTLAVGGMAGKYFLSCSASTASHNGIGDFGIQLYTLRDDMPKDPKGVLKQLASFGYKQIESYEGPTGMFWGMSPKEFKIYVEDLGMNVVASHCDVTRNFEKKAEEAASIGMKYLICPWIGPQASVNGYKKFAAEFNAKGEICAKNGLRFAYHNHDYSFTETEGQIPQEILINETDEKLVDFEMDIYWVVTGGGNPVALLKKYPNRFRLSHVKDRIKNSTEKNASCTLGEGSIDFPEILKTAKENGMQYFIVEQERYDGTTPLKAVEANAGYMKKLRI